MIKKFTNRVICFILTLLIVTQILPFGALSAENIPDVSANDAIKIACALIGDTVKLDKDTKWSEDTKLQKIVTLYDENDLISGYSVELSKNGTYNGYITISAYDDVDLITEYSDSATPVYKNLNLENGDKVLYTGTLDYHKKDKKNKIKNLHNKSVEKKDIKNAFKNMGNKKTKDDNKKMLKEIKKNKSFVDSAETGSLATPRINTDGTDSEDTIKDPIMWSEFYYGYTFKAYEWKNAFEKHCDFLIMTDFDNKPGSASDGGHCGPTALLNIMRMQRNYGIFNTLPISNFSVFETVGNMWKTRVVPNYSFNAVKDWIAYCYWEYGRTAWISYKEFWGKTSDNDGIYNYVKTCIDANHPMWVGIRQPANTVYTQNGHHAVAGYAYTRLKNTSTGAFHSFIKIMDGWIAEGRYVSMTNFRGHIHEINLR